MTAPDTAALRLSGTKLTADLDAAITGITVQSSEGSVANLSVTSADPAGVLMKSAFAKTGTTVTWYDDTWQVAGLTTRWGSDNTIEHSIDCRSSLARQLRKRYRASVEKKVSPSEWVARRVRSAGGVAVCQPSSRQATIAQTSGAQRQSELDVIADLASQAEWSWVEWGGRLWFGSRHWAWSGNASGQRLWPVTRASNPASDHIEAEISQDDDDTANRASGTVTVPYGYGVRIRPWDRLQLSGYGNRDGIYLVDQVSIEADLVRPIQLGISRPRPPAKKSGSAS